MIFLVPKPWIHPPAACPKFFSHRLLALHSPLPSAVGLRWGQDRGIALVEDSPSLKIPRSQGYKELLGHTQPCALATMLLVMEQGERVVSLPWKGILIASITGRLTFPHFSPSLLRLPTSTTPSRCLQPRSPPWFTRRHPPPSAPLLSPARLLSATGSRRASFR